MLKEYTILKCFKCNKTTIVLTSEIESGRYLVCSHCSNKNTRKTKETDDLRECMNHSMYKRERGAIRQVK
jgi:DNA-directed RNA polymerase subunit RPC12/RpoP